MADFVSRKVRMTDTESLAVCKDYLRARYQMLYDEALWRDACRILDFTLTPNNSAGSLVDPNTWGSYAGTVFLPDSVERVLNVRQLASPLDVVTNDGLMGSALDDFAETGTPVRYQVLPPAVWMNADTLQATLTPGNTGTMTGADPATDAMTVTATNWWTGMPFTLESVPDVGIEHVPVGLSEGVIYYAIKLGPVTVQAAATYADALAGVAVDITAIEVGDVRVHPLAVVRLECESAADYGTEVKLTIVDNAGRRRDVTLIGGAVTVGADGYVLENNCIGDVSEIVRATKDQTEGRIHLIALDASRILTMEKGDTEAPARLRVRLFPCPTSAVNCRALVKEKVTALDADTDALRVRGLVNCLLALAHADMLEYGRQYAKAQAKAQEGLGLLEQAKRIETLHEANRVRIVPASDGAGWPECETAGKAYW